MIRANKRFKKIIKALNDRDIVWFGTRGTDAEPLLNFIKPLLIVSQIAPLPEETIQSVQQDCLETRTHRRVDLDRYDIDLDFTKEAMGLKLSLLRHVSNPIALMAYRAAEFLASVEFTNPLVGLFAPFHLIQRQLEHKPWVERQLKRIEVPILPWQYVRDGDLDTVSSCLGQGPLVGRTNTGAGGAGIFIFNSIDEFKILIPEHHDGFIGLSPYLAGAIPLNVNACVYDTGEVHVFTPSVQLIGIKECTCRPLGYCGNDYFAAGALPSDLHDKIEETAVKIGQWLRNIGYLGIFGLDYLAYEEKVIITEINPRFQGSTPICAKFCQTLGWPDPFTEHIAAFIGIGAPIGSPDCREQSASVSNSAGTIPASHIVYHNLNSQSIRVRGYSLPAKDSSITLDCVPGPDVYIDPEATIMKSIHCHRVTEQGYQLNERAIGLRSLLELGY